MPRTGPRTVASGIPVYCAYSELMPAGNLKPNPKNPNKHPDSQIAVLADVIRRQGWRAPITISRRSGLIVRGHARLLAAERLGVELVPVDKQNYATEADEWADLVADNRLAELAETDDALLKAILEDINRESDLLLAGYNADEFQELERRLQPDEESGEDDYDAHAKAESITEPVTKPGEVWLLGRHRLMCGDGTVAADVAKLMAGEQAELVFTDPPYGVSYLEADGRMIRGDDQRDDNLAQFLLAAFRLAVEHTTPAAPFYIWHASATRRDYEWALDAAGLQERQYLVWAKDSFVLGWADYHWQHEPCFYCAKAGERPAFYADRGQSTVWRFGITAAGAERAIALANGLRLSTGAGEGMYVGPQAPKGKKLRLIRIRQGESVMLLRAPADADVWEISHDRGRAIHPTQKPVALAGRAILNSTRPRERVLDLFGGSGSTLIAAEHFDRQAFVMEIDARFCDAIRDRWEKYSNRKAVKADDGGT